MRTNLEQCYNFWILKILLILSYSLGFSLFQSPTLSTQSLSLGFSPLSSLICLLSSSFSLFSHAAKEKQEFHYYQHYFKICFLDLTSCRDRATRSRGNTFSVFFFFFLCFLMSSDIFVSIWYDKFCFEVVCSLCNARGIKSRRRRERVWGGKNKSSHIFIIFFQTAVSFHT